MGITSPRPVNFMAKEELFKIPILKSLLPGVNAFPVKRGLSDRDALRKALKLIKRRRSSWPFSRGHKK